MKCLKSTSWLAMRLIPQSFWKRSISPLRGGQQRQRVAKADEQHLEGHAQSICYHTTCRVDRDCARIVQRVRVLSINVKWSYNALLTQLTQLRDRGIFGYVEGCGDLLDRY